MSDVGGAAIHALGVRKRLRAGAILFQAGDPAGGFYLIESGAVRVYKTDERGRELEVVRLERGDFLGEAIALAEGRFPFSAEAVEEAAVRYFEREAVWRAVERSTETARFFVTLLARKCVFLSNRVESLGLRTVRQRLAEYLIHRCPGACPGVVELEVTKGELARLLGTVGETISRTLKQMQAEGLIDVKGRAICLRDCARLRAELNQGT